MPNLLVLTGAQQGLVLPLPGERTVLGRDGRCDVVITDAMLPADTPGRQADSISRRHAVILRDGARHLLHDGDGRGKRSRNGTFVNERPVPFPAGVELNNHDRIRICDFVCLFQTDELPSSVEAAIRHDSSSAFLQVQSPDKLQILLEISNSLANTLEVDALLLRIVDRLFHLFEQADRGFVILRDEATGQLVPRVFRTRHPGEPADSRFSVSIVRRCLDKVEAILGNDLAEQFPNVQSVAGLPVRSLMCAPLWSAEGSALGAIQLDTKNAKRKFTQLDLNLLLGVASQASIALSNARYHRDSLAHQGRLRDLQVAQDVQRALLPQGLPDVPGYEFYAYYDPALEVGGDYYDFIPLPGGRLAVLLGDVAGKGVPAALVMVKFSVEARVCLLTEPDLAAAVLKLNGVMTRAGLAGRFVTLIAAVLDPAGHTVTLVDAGHPSPLLARRATGAVEPAVPHEATGPPLGLFGNDRWSSCQVRLEPGDRLLLFSDGATEAEDAGGRPFRAAGVRAVLEGLPLPPGATGERLVEAVKRHAAGCRQNDDITVVCLGRSATE